MQHPLVTLDHLDDLWLQVTGTLCNLACSHCFISCSPHNDRFGFLDVATIRQALEDSVPLGVKEYYFTGGEPFLHPEMTAILELTLRYGPATVLTNGTLFADESLARLRAAEDGSPYSLEFRVSLDGATPEENDAVRGHGTFERVLRGVRQLLASDFLPILTVARVNESDDDERMVEDFTQLLKQHGYDRPRIKLLPTLRLGAEVQRCRGYGPEERVSLEMMEGYDRSQLLCSHSRVVTDRGVYVCPILLEAPDARLGGTLGEAAPSFELRHQACYTCWQYGALCANTASQRRDA